MSTGKGRINLTDKQTNIFRRDHDQYYGLKLKASKQTISCFNDKYFPINVQDKLNARFKMGLNECLNHKLLVDYPVMSEKEDEFISRIKFTVIVRRKTKKNKKGHILITGKSSEEELTKIKINNELLKNNIKNKN